MSRLGASQLELPLEIGQGDIDIAHGHGWIDMAESLHQDREADTGAQHLCGIGVPELMGDDLCGKSERVADLMQVIAELDEDSYFASGTRQKVAVIRQGIQGAEEAQAMHEIATEGIDGDHALGSEFTERDMNSPLVWGGSAQAVVRQIDTLTDAHAGVADQEEDV